MQAGNRLSFVEPFDSVGERKEISTDRMIETFRYFLEMCGRILEKHAKDVEAVELLEESGFVTAYELSLKVPSDDGSYLHVLVFGHKQGTSILDLGISLIEHGPGNVYGGGYQYIATGIDVRRSTARIIEAEQEEAEEDEVVHFSILDLYAVRDQLYDIEQSGDEEARQIAVDTFAGLKEDIAFGQWEEEMGFDNQLIDKGELEKVSAIVASAEPFPLPHHGPRDDTVY